MSKQPLQGSELSNGQAVSLSPTESELEPLANSKSLPKLLTMACLSLCHSSSVSVLKCKKSPKL